MMNWKSHPSYDGHEDVVFVGDQALGFAGIVAIQNGENPRFIEERLKSYMGGEGSAVSVGDPPSCSDTPIATAAVADFGTIDGSNAASAPRA